MRSANFSHHLLNRGIKMIVTKAITPVGLLSYQMIICRVPKEAGGVRAAYYYDALQHEKIAKALPNNPSLDVCAFFNKVDHDTLKNAQAKYDTKAKEPGRDNARQQAAPGEGWPRGHGLQEEKPWDLPPCVIPVGWAPSPAANGSFGVHSWALYMQPGGPGRSLQGPAGHLLTADAPHIR